MKINVQIEPEKKDLGSSIKERNNMFRDLLVEVRKMQSDSMSKMMTAINKMKPEKARDNSSVLIQAIKESSRSNQSMMKTLKSMSSHKPAENNGKEMKMVMDMSNSMLKTLKEISMRKPSESRPVVVKTVNTKSIETLIDAFKSRSFGVRPRWEISAS